MAIGYGKSKYLITLIAERRDSSLVNVLEQQDLDVGSVEGLQDLDLARSSERASTLLLVRWCVQVVLGCIGPVSLGVVVGGGWGLSRHVCCFECQMDGRWSGERRRRVKEKEMKDEEKKRRNLEAEVF